MRYTRLFRSLFIPMLLIVNSVYADLYEKSYAIVVGINSYANDIWEDLNYAVLDAQGMARFLRLQGFKVKEFYNEEATKHAIEAAMEDELAPQLTKDERVLFFFAGHGNTKRIGGNDRGYLVPVDATEVTSSQISMGRFRELSGMMGNAKHQLFIVDACYGGLLATRGSTVNPRIPNYINHVTKRNARQILTAGGADQRVADGGPGQHSLFTGELLKALEEGLGDSNGDGYVTFTELSSYMQVAASQFNQTPGVGYLEGHQLGEFTFSPKRLARLQSASTAESGESMRFRSSGVDVYKLIAKGKQAFLFEDYPSAFTAFDEAAKQGNAEAMVFLGLMYFNGWGIMSDREEALKWYLAAAERGDVKAMRSLENFYLYGGAHFNKLESDRWKHAANEAEKFELDLVLLDPSGQAGMDEPEIPSRKVVLPRPLPPLNLRIE